ncbi:MAG: translation initiation factor IF-2 [Myxococcales bacterium]|nr:translation initiation factor IF-2 [Myxococcales bacterium]
MSNVRVYELAKELGIETKTLLSRIGELGIIASSHMTMLTPEEAAKIRTSVSSNPVGDVIEKRIKPTVIRRRSRRATAAEGGDDDGSADASESNAAGADTAPISQAAQDEGPSTDAEPVSAEAVGDAQPTAVAEERVEGAPTSTPSPTQVPTTTTRPSRGPRRREEPTSQLVLVATPEQRQATLEARGITPSSTLTQPPKPKAAVPTDGRVPEIKDDRDDKKKGVRGKKVVYDRRRDSSQRRFVREGDEIGGRGGRGKRKKAKPRKIEKTQLTTPKAAKRVIKIDESIMVGDLAKQMGVKFGEMAGKLMQMGTMVTITDRLDLETAELITAEFGFTVESVGFELDDHLAKTGRETDGGMRRSPVVTIMGHVDHGKTSLLDRIRSTQVAASEHGGITQHIGAYKVKTDRGQVVFLDTPGHEAFTAMRARGAKVTDIVVLVVAADDGVMLQTVEAINHARAAGVPIVVAVNKIDRPQANADRVRQGLTEHGLVPEEWGGDTIFCNVSAKTGDGIDTLLEMLALQSEILELQADPDLPAQGVVIESRLDRGKGPIATVLVQNGTLRKGEYLVSGIYYGRVRAMINEWGEDLESAGPSTPVEIWGLNGVPEAGNDIDIATTERDAKVITDYRGRKEREREMAAKTRTSKVSFEDLMAQVQSGQVKDLNLIVKADVQGSVEAISDAFLKVKHAEVEVRVLHKSVGGIIESDINLASASNAIVVGFNVRPEPSAKALAEREGVDIKLYSVIYDAIDDLKKAMEGMLEPTYEEDVLGRAEVLETFQVPRAGTVAGCNVRSGKILRSAKARLVRDSVQIYTGGISSLRRFKDDVREVVQGYECGISLENYNDIKVGDIIECYEMKAVRQTLN